MKSALLHLILAVCIISWDKVMLLQQILLLAITEEKHSANSCPRVDAQNESFQLIRNNVISTIRNYSYYYDVASVHCGKGLWHRIAYLNMTDPSQQCPSNWRQYNVNASVRACGRFGVSCPGVFYSVGHQYSKVCGRIIGYQVAMLFTYICHLRT